MTDIDYDDPTLEDDWIRTKRIQVTTYLRDQNLNHGAIGNFPAWHVAPCTSVWAVESFIAPGYVGWWAVCGDHPTDYIAASTKHPRGALRVFSQNWTKLAADMKAKRPLFSSWIGNRSNSRHLATLLDGRAKAFLAFAEDDELWDYDESEFEIP